MKILSGKELRPILKKRILKELEDTKISFYLYSNKEDFPSQAYLRGIKKTLDLFLISYEEGFIDLSLSKEENLDRFQKESKGHSILMARPLHVDYEDDFLKRIPSNGDPDMLTVENRGKLFGGDLSYLTATSQSVKCILEEYKIDVAGKKAVIIGRSTEVGYPCFQLMNKKNAAATLLHSKIDQKTMCEYVQNADIVIFATGKSGLIPRECFHSNQIIIDCGFNPQGGDLGFIPTDNEFAAYTPVPGGVGALTSYCLLLNAIHLKKN
jgi:methylenetetrahydrofolate dehydrogenase (NADP+) / methenyltetrahydrofolate cyclohydrolase